jgi:hypothetical protein
MHTQLSTLTLVTVLLAPAAFAQNSDAEGKKGKGKGQAALSATAQLLKQMESAGLTDEQTAKIKEMGKKAEEEIKKLHAEAELTPALLKKRREAQASMKDSDKKGKARVQAIDAAAGLNEKQAAAVAKANALRTKLKTDAVKLLSDEQKSKLPEAFTATLGVGKAANPTGKEAGQKKGKQKAESN